MKPAFKHIRKPGEQHMESLGDKTTLYLWEQIKSGDWVERTWGFELFVNTSDGVHADSFVAQITSARDVTAIPELTAKVFEDLDKAGQYLNEQVQQKMGWGYRRARPPQPTE